MMRAKYIIFILMIWGSPAVAEIDVRAKPFGKTPAGDTVTLYTVTNSNKASLGVIDYGESHPGPKGQGRQRIQPPSRLLRGNPACPGFAE